MLRCVLLFVVLVATQMVPEVQSASQRNVKQPMTFFPPLHVRSTSGALNAILGGTISRRFPMKDPDNVDSHSNSMISKVSLKLNKTLSANKTEEDTELSSDSKYQDGGLDLEKKFKLKELPIDQFFPNTTEVYTPPNKGVVGSEGQDKPDNKDKK